MRFWLEQQSQETKPEALFPQPPVVRFICERDRCACGRRLTVQKTRKKTVFGLIGPFKAHETVLECKTCRRAYFSDALLRQVPPRCNVAYAVMIYVGKALFQQHRNGSEILADLASRNIRLSPSEITYLGRKFIMYLAEAHRRTTPGIRKAMQMAGGYILHLDAMHEGDSPALMTGIDSLSEIVLGNVKLPSERADHIAKFLRKIRKDYGQPAACVHDMGRGICTAVKEVFPGVLDFICHFHFLRDIGKDFLDLAYGVMRKRLQHLAASTRLQTLKRELFRRLEQDEDGARAVAGAIAASELPEESDQFRDAVTYSLILWALNGKNAGDGYGYPFDRPLLTFVDRLADIHRQMPKLMAGPSGGNQRIKNPLVKLREITRDIFSDKQLSNAVRELHWRTEVFDRLRDAMRIARPGGKNGLNDEGDAEAMTSIREGVEAFRRNLDEDNRLKSDRLALKMAAQIDKYHAKLFADPIELETPAGKIIVYPQRTNNILERFFRDWRRGYRRRTGDNSMCRSLQAMLADTPLVKNLDNPKYMGILLNGCADLEELFCGLTDRYTGKLMDQAKKERQVLPGYKELMRMPNLVEHIKNLSVGHA